MPIYDYRCRACQFEIEVLQKATDESLKTCPSCQKETLFKCVSAPSVRFSGGGYYETDEKPKDKQRHILTKDSDKPAQATPSSSNTE